MVLKTKEKWWLDREGSRGWREAVGWLGWSGRILRKEETGWRRKEGNRVRLGFDLI